VPPIAIEGGLQRPQLPTRGASSSAEAGPSSSASFSTAGPWAESTAPKMASGLIFGSVAACDPVRLLQQAEAMDAEAIAEARRAALACNTMEEHCRAAIAAVRNMFARRQAEAEAEAEAASAEAAGAEAEAAKADGSTGAEEDEMSEATEPAEPTEPTEQADAAEPVEPAETAETAETAEVAEPAEAAEAMDVEGMDVEASDEATGKAAAASDEAMGEADVATDEATDKAAAAATSEAAEAAEGDSVQNGVSALKAPTTRYFGTTLDLGGLPLMHALIAKGQTTGLPSRLPLPLGMHAVPPKASSLPPHLTALGGLGGGGGGGGASVHNSLDLEGHIVSELATLEALGIHGDTDLGLLDSMMDSEQLLMMGMTTS